MERVSQPAGNYYDKYHTRNPVARYLMNGFLGAFDDLAGLSGAQSAIEVGCGEAELCIRLARRGLHVRGCDIADEVLPVARERIEEAGLEIEVWSADVLSLGPEHADELVVCCEVLEHVDDPRQAVQRLASLAKPFLLTSVPREPLWRVLNVCRGKYLGSLGNTPGHVNHWSQQAFLELLGSHFEVVEVRTPLPWTMVLCRVKDQG
jgi:2-polyprenyl-3-methyl-5-hydroxy-6-metoxy-1,4-benzoquinol methylase